MTIALVAKLQVQPDKAQEFEAAFAKCQEAVKAEEPGCTLYVLCRDKKEAGVYWVQEQYADGDALKAHGQGEQMKPAMAALAPFMAGAPEINVCDVV